VGSVDRERQIAELVDDQQLGLAVMSELLVQAAVLVRLGELRHQGGCGHGQHL
jgi:hypothetical protein